MTLSRHRKRRNKKLRQKEPKQKRQGRNPKKRNNKKSSEPLPRRQLLLCKRLRRKAAQVLPLKRKSRQLYRLVRNKLASLMLMKLGMKDLRWSRTNSRPLVRKSILKLKLPEQPTRLLKRDRLPFKTRRSTTP